MKNKKHMHFPVGNLQQSRRQFMKVALAGMTLGVTAAIFPSIAALPLNGKRILIAWFSRSGNTQHVAQYIHSMTGGDIFEIKATHTYPDEYRATTRQARRELDENFRPALTSHVENLADYGLIILGYPNWWGTMPMAVFSFLESGDFSGKKILPFCTHEGSQMGRSRQDIEGLVPTADVSEGLPLRGGGVRSDSAHSAVQHWLKQHNVA